MSFGGAHAAEAQVHRWCAGVQERLQLGRRWAFVRQDPRAGLHHVEVRRLLPRGQDRVGRQPRVAGDDVVADVVHRGRPIDARLVLSAGPYSALSFWMSRSFSTQWSVTSGGNGRPGSGRGRRCGDGRKIGQ
jgi:hypothetical protein